MFRKAMYFLFAVSFFTAFNSYATEEVAANENEVVANDETDLTSDCEVADVSDSTETTEVSDCTEAADGSDCTEVEVADNTEQSCGGEEKNDQE